MTDRVIKTAGAWALASDGHQWMLMRRHKRPGKVDTWDPISFVSSTRTILARCCAEKGVEAGTAAILLEGLPDSFDLWKRSQSGLERPEPPAAPGLDPEGRPPG
jgi:hypothetical protein